MSDQHSHDEVIDHDRGEVPEEMERVLSGPRRLHGWDFQGTHTEIMPDCVASSIFEGRTFIAESGDGTISFVVLRNWTLLQLDPEHAPTSNQPRLFDVSNYETPQRQDG